MNFLQTPFDGWLRQIPSVDGVGVGQSPAYTVGSFGRVTISEGAIPEGYALMHDGTGKNWQLIRVPLKDGK